MWDFPLTLLTGRRLGLQKDIVWRLVALAPIVLLTHIAYDVFAATYIESGTGSQFPLLLPVSFSSVTLPSWTWLPLELVATVGSFMVFLATKKLRQY